MSIESVMPSNHLILCRPLLLLPLIFPRIRVFSNEPVVHIRGPKYWSFNFSISPSNEYSGLIPLELTGLISWLPKGLSRVFSNTQFESINSSAVPFPGPLSLLLSYLSTSFTPPPPGSSCKESSTGLLLSEAQGLVLKSTLPHSAPM